MTYLFLVGGVLLLLAACEPPPNLPVVMAAPAHLDGVVRFNVQFVGWGRAAPPDWISRFVEQLAPSGYFDGLKAFGLSPQLVEDTVSAARILVELRGPNYGAPTSEATAWHTWENNAARIVIEPFAASNDAVLTGALTHEIVEVLMDPGGQRAEDEVADRCENSSTGYAVGRRFEIHYVNLARYWTGAGCFPEI